MAELKQNPAVNTCLAEQNLTSLQSLPISYKDLCRHALLTIWPQCSCLHPIVSAPLKGVEKSTTERLHNSFAIAFNAATTQWSHQSAKPFAPTWQSYATTQAKKLFLKKPNAMSWQPSAVVRCPKLAKNCKRATCHLLLIHKYPYKPCTRKGTRRNTCLLDSSTSRLVKLRRR